MVAQIYHVIIHYIGNYRLCQLPAARTAVRDNRDTPSDAYSCGGGGQVQIDAGASAVQLFDSWVGALPRADYLRFVEPHSRAVLAAVGERVPRIHFGVGTGELLADMADAGADVIGVDYRVSLTDALARTGGRYAVQGNLDPALLFAPWPVIEERVRSIVEEGRAAPGHIFNLGHGVLPATDPTVLTRVVELVHSLG